jgi:hypothetical protein
LEKSTAARFKAAPGRGKVRRFAQFHDAAESWSRVERIIPASRPGLREPIPGSSSPVSKPAAPSSFTLKHGKKPLLVDRVVVPLEVDPDWETAGAAS